MRWQTGTLGGVVFGTALMLGACSQNQPTPAEKIETSDAAKVVPPPGGDWTKAVTETPGGFLMGNPNAKVKLVEIASLGCPFCKRFADEGAARLLELVESGEVSWEFRPYIIHGPVDMAANLIARCNGPEGFFPLMEALYRDQRQWMGKVEAAPPAQLAEAQNMAPNQAFVAVAKLAELQLWAAQHGLPSGKSNQCLSSQQMIEREVQGTADVNSDFPDFKGTPAFAINGKLLPDVSNWAALQPKVEEALR